MASYSLTNFAYQAARDLGCIRAGQGLAPDILNDILNAANEMVEQWLLDRDLTPESVPQTFTLTPGVQIYTIGPNETGGNFVATRPIEIRDANIILNTFSPVLRLPLDIINVDQWANIRIQTLPNNIPRRLYFEKSFSITPTLGAARMLFWPGPLTNYQFEMFSTDQVTLGAFPDLTTAVNYPPGYPLMIRKNLAVHIAPLMTMYSKAARTDSIMAPTNEMLAEVRRQAMEAMERIESYNAPDPILTYDQAFSSSNGKRGRFNYLLGVNGRNV